MTPTFMGMPLRLENYGAALNGVTPDDAAFAAAVADAEARTWSTCRIQWNGALTLTRQPPPLYRVHLEGDDICGSTVIKNYPGGLLFQFAGPPGFSGGGLHNFAVPSTPGTAGSYLIYSAPPNSDYAPDCLILDHLYLASGVAADAPFRNIHLDGSARLSPPGLRQVIIEHVTCFGATGGNCWFAALDAARIDDLSTFDVPGTDGDVYLEGGNGFPGAEITIRASTISTALHIGHLWDVQVAADIGEIHWDDPAAANVSIQTRNQGVPQVGSMPASCRVWS